MQSWRATINTPQPLVAALHIRDGAGLDVFDTAPGIDAVPPLEPAVEPDYALVRIATGAAAAAWVGWWESMVDRHPEFSGVPPLVPDPIPPLDPDLQALITTGLPAADAWFEADKRRSLDELRATGRPPVGGISMHLGDIVRGVEAELGHAAASFDLLISVLPVTGLWGRRARRDHVLISSTMSGHRAALETLFEPVVRELAQEP